MFWNQSNFHEHSPLVLGIVSILPAELQYYQNRNTKQQAKYWRIK